MKPQEPGTLATRTTITQILGVSRQAVAKIVHRADFPEPIDVPDSNTPVWSRDEVKRWKRARERTKAAA